jgi:hypothetical protein
MNAVVSLAVPGDDAGIRGLVRREALPGRIRVAFPREPDFSLGCAVTGTDVRIVVARSMDDGAVVGVACRSIRNVFVNGRPERIGYLGQLRIDERFRGRWLVSRGFSLVADLDRDRPVRRYLASIVDGNEQATGVLVTKRRRRFPAFREAARYETLALRVQRSRPPVGGREDVVPGSADQLEALAAFLQAEGARRQFSTVWSAGALRDLEALGLPPGDIRIARDGGRIVGAIALWDQRAYKQAVVRGYTGWLRAIAPLMKLPRVGQQIRNAYASLVCVARDDAAVFGRLLGEVNDLARVRGFEYVLVGLDARDPLLAVARAHPHIAYASRLYVGTWPSGFTRLAESQGAANEYVDDRPAYVDIATL